MNSRSIIRNMLKLKQGNNRIGKTWRRMQIKKYGRADLLKMHIDCDTKRRQAPNIVDAFNLAI